MAGGTPAPGVAEKLLAGAQQAVPDPAIVVADATNKVPASRTLRFDTARVDAASVDEDLDKGVPAHVVLTLIEPAFVMMLPGGMVARGGEAFQTTFTPDLAIAVGNELVKLGEEAKATMTGRTRLAGLAATPAEARAAAAAADSLAALKGEPGT